ncbi:MAG: hypothetical protein CMM50_02030 [Rhodospirillaceae bacterium]|nr:hypothetical protein [Rhodospirillaceae bacterium]
MHLLLIAVLILGLVAFFTFDLGSYVSFDALRAHHQALADFVNEHLAVAMLLFGLAYAVAVAFSLPVGSVMTVTGGFLFGQIVGTILTVVSATVGATALFLIAKTALGDPLRERAGPWLARMEKGFQEDAFNYLLFLRLIPVFPFFAVNLVPAFLGVGLRTYVVTTFIGIIPGTFVYTSIGAALRELVEAGGDFSIQLALEPEIIAALVGLAVLSLIPVAYRRIKGTKKT